MGGIKIAIDRGGTFTDVIAFIEGKEDYVFKLLSVDPSNYNDANIEGIRRVLEHATGNKYPRGEPLDTSLIESLKLGTTVATNALLERKGERCALITTKGFKDALIIGNQTRPHIFDLAIKRPDVLYETVVEVDERVTLEDYAEDPDQIVTTEFNDDLVKGLSGEVVRILKRPDLDSIRSTLKVLYDTGIRSIGVCLLHSFTFDKHEKLIGEIAKEIGFNHISLSSELSPMIKFIPRANSSVSDAYLTPEIKKYLTSFQSGLKDGLQSVVERKTTGVRCQFMKSDGGMVDSSKFSGLKAILSGPAGGVVGLAETSYDPKNKIPIIGLDVGGTSTDCSRFDGKYDHVFETTTAGITIQSPQLDINTIAAGGGSRLFYQNGLMRVGPESASAHPGPVCYRKNGYLTVTDANAVLERLVPEFFPKIFGPNEDETLDIEASVKAFESLTQEINKENPGKKMTVQEIAEGFLNVANEAMARPIRTLTEAKGHVLAKHRLVSFGGGGGQCCCFVAFDKLGIDTVLIHRYSSVLSAYGMALADVVEEVQEPSSLVLEQSTESKITLTFDSLKEKATKSLQEQGFKDEEIIFEEYLNLRYRGTESAIMTTDAHNVATYANVFESLHKQEFGFTFEDKDILIDDVRVRAIGKSHKVDTFSVDDQFAELESAGAIAKISKEKASLFKNTYFGGKFYETPVYRLESCEIGHQIPGPAIIADGTQTNVIPPESVATILKTHVVVKNLKEKSVTQVDFDANNQIKIDPILLSIFGHRFIDIADQMGHSLQKTAVSTNVKERLDFSCALFDADANLVSSAPHIPVHLGSMGTFVKFQSKYWEGKLKPGDVIVGNHPLCGNTHLPDITVMTPVFHDNKIVFYLASRAHHSDIGSILPGSMPPNSKELWEEGAMIHAELLVKDGVFQEERMTELLLVEPAKYPGSSGTRKLSDNISDLKAQVAANQKGIGLIELLVKEFGLKVVLAYMEAIQANAANTVQKLLTKIGDKTLQAEDFMDDGSRINLQVKIKGGEAVFDFTGTSPQMYGNLNAPTAITYSALIYCLRCLVNEDIPLNQGFLRPMEIIIPPNSLLSPGEGAAVVAGNVMTSQRITDVIFKAFEAMAGSQGDCNNFTFGTGGNSENGYVKGFGYYETIAGGHGAGPTWNGVSAVHTNMTNTKMTDVEVFEKRYPVILREFGIREGSGGSGKFHGGNGAVRDIEFRIPLKASILSERRVNAPYGLLGGEPGARGLNLLVRKVFDKNGKFVEEKTINIGGKNTVSVEKGDRIVLLTPGGGGYGLYEGKFSLDGEKELDPRFSFRGSGSINLRHDTQYTN